MNTTRRFDAGLMSAAVASLFFISVPAIGQEAAGKPTGMPWGPVVVYPEADVTFKSNDNIYSQRNDRKRADITVLAPKVKLEAKTGPHIFDVTVGLEHGSYGNVSSANYLDHSVTGNAMWVFSGRSGLKLTADFKQGHDDQGAVPGATTHANPDKWHQSSFSGVGGYGAEGAQGRVELEGGVTSKRYENFMTAANGDPDNAKRDRDDTKLGATFYWRIMPKTQLLFQTTQTKFDYKQATVAAWTTLDSTDRSNLLGVTWDAAAKTKGIFKMGSMRKDFVDETRKDFSGSSWDGTVKWSPLSYSTFDFNTGRTTGEASVGSASIDRKAGVAWNHAWNSRLSSVASLSNTRTEYQYSAIDTGVATPQTDRTNALGMKLNYQWMRTVKLGAGYDRTEKASTSPGSEYMRNIYSLFLSAAI